MTRRLSRSRRRLFALLLCGAGLAAATALTLNALGDGMVFYVPPSELAAKAVPGRTVRMGGLVEAGSLRRATEDGHPVARFRLTDGRADVEVSYAGILPDLLREGQGAVTLGSVQPDGSFRAQEVLAKHDENYIPRDVADTLRRNGMWRPEQGAPPPAATWNTLPSGGQAPGPISGSGQVLGQSDAPRAGG